MLKVLVPSDGSTNAQYGVHRVVSEFMKHKDLDIHIVNVQRPFSRHISRFLGHGNRNEFHYEQSEQALLPARKVLDSAGIPYTVHAEVGDKATCIADVARRLGCDRIVMGTARKSSLTRAVQDSVTNKVVARCSVPVEVIAGDASSRLERVGIPTGLGASLIALWLAAD